MLENEIMAFSNDEKGNRYLDYNADCRGKS